MQILCKLLYNILYLKATTYEMREVTSGKLLSQHPCKNEQYIYSKDTILFHELYYQLYYFFFKLIYLIFYFSDFFNNIIS